MKEADQRPGASEKNVKLDVKGSQTGAAPGGAIAASPRPAAAHALVGPGLSGALSFPAGRLAPIIVVVVRHTVRYPRTLSSVVLAWEFLVAWTCSLDALNAA